MISVLVLPSVVRRSEYGSGEDLVKDVALQADGKILAAGVAGCRDPHPEFALARYDTSGVLDRSFGGDGKVTRHIGASEDCFDQIDAVALQPDAQSFIRFAHGRVAITAHRTGSRFRRWARFSCAYSS
jgi:hypothetical protein